jgi:uncharacterized protein
MKSSKYNIFVDFPENRIRLAFNAFTLALVEFTFDEGIIVEKILDGPNIPHKTNGKSTKFKEIKETLVKGGFLIDESMDEIEILKSKNRISRFAQNNHIGLTIAPTLSCNFRCIYCYEKHKKDRMNLRIMRSLLGWAEKATTGGKNLSVTWFGGEPLLAMREIQYLSKGFLTISEKNKAKYSADIITNGFLLDRKTAAKLKKHHVTKAQITIDGPKNIHDKRRPLVNGKGTFDVILENIKNCCDLLEITLRINVDKTNSAYVYDVLDMLEKENLKNKVLPYIGYVYPYTEVCADAQKVCMGKEQYCLMQAKMRLEMTERGYSFSAYPMLKGGFCTADSLHSATISPSGSIVKCWNDICYEVKSVNHILGEKTPQMQSNFAKWVAWDPFEKEECRECQILPICMGGCPYLAYEKGLKEKGECIDWKYNLKEMLSLYYLQKKKKQEIEVAQALFSKVEELRKEIKQAPAS